MADEHQTTGWQSIEDLPEHTPALVGRWNGVGTGRRYWSRIIAHWFMVNGQKEWTYREHHRESPFYDDDGNYAEPTHFAPIPPEPPEPKR